MSEDATPEQEWSSERLQQEDESRFDTEQISFVGVRGDEARHLKHAELLQKLDFLSSAPRDVGRVDLIVARPEPGARVVLSQADLTVEGGLTGDRWVGEDKYGSEYQMATTQTDYARTVANGQALELHGDNLFLSLDLSAENLPIGSRLRLGDSIVEVTPKAHNGCRKWVQRFGLAAMKLNMEARWQEKHLRGIYLRVVEAGVARVGDEVRVLTRGQ